MKAFNSILLIFLLFISSQISGYTYDRDISLEKCIRESNYTNSAMIDCTIKRKTEIKSYSDKLINNLKISNNFNYLKICDNQNLLNDYLISLRQGEIKILNSTLGTMYALFAENILLSDQEVNSQILEILYTGNKPKRNISDGKFSMDKLENEVNKNLKALESNLSKEQYNRILQSQKHWNIYRKDVEVNILPLINKPELKIYIKRLILENRISTLNCLKYISK